MTPRRNQPTRHPFLLMLLVLSLAFAASTPASGAVQASPANVSLFATEASGVIRLELTYSPQTVVSEGTVAVTLPRALEGNTRVSPMPLTYTVPLGSSRTSTTFRIVTSAETPVGTWTVGLRDLSLGAGGTTVRLTVRRPTVSALVSPNPVELSSGGPSALVSVTTLAGTGFTDSLRYELSGFPASLEAGPPALSSAPDYPPVNFSIRALPGAPAGTFTGRLRGFGGGRLLVDLPLAARVLAPLPIIDRVIPGRVVAGATGQQVQLVGRNFEPGAGLTVDSPTLQLEEVRVLSSTLAQVRVRVPRNAASQVVGLTLENPSGGRSPNPGRLTVLAPESIATPLAVTSIAVVFPRPGAHLSQDESLVPRGKIAVAGSGTLTGSWLFDGIPFERFSVRAVAGQPVTVVGRSPLPHLGLGAHRLSLRVEHPQDLHSPPIPILETRGKASELRLLRPSAGASAPISRARFSWTLVPGAASYRLEVKAFPRGQIVEFQTSEASLALSSEARRHLPVGPLLWRVTPIFGGETPGAPSPWQALTLAGEDAVDGAEGMASSASRHLRLFARQDSEDFLEAEEDSTTGTLGWSANLEATLSDSEGDEPLEAAEGTLALSGQVAYDGSGNSGKATAELSYRHPFEGEEDPDTLDQNWLAQGRLGGETTALDFQAGFSAPRFLEDLLLLDGGLARGGAGLRLEAPGHLSISAYSTFDPEVGSISSGSFEEDQKLQGAALRWGKAEDIYRLQVSALETEQEPGDFSLGGEGEILGAAGRYESSSGFTLRVEGARSRLSAGAPGLEDELESLEETEGDAYRLDLEGSLGALSVHVDIQRVEAGFANPVSLDFSEAGPADRDSAKLDLSLPLGSTSLELTLGQSEGGDAFGPGGEVRHGELGLSGEAGTVLHFSLRGGWTETTADEDPELFLDATERQETHLQVELRESFGPLELSQNASWERQEDGLDPFLDSTTSSAGLGLQGTFSQGGVNLSVSGTRVEGDASLGTTESLTASLQPNWRIPRLHLDVTPYLVYSRATNDLFLSEDISEVGQLTLSWAPPWGGSWASLQVSGAWSRSYSQDLAPRPDFAGRYRAALTLSWGGERFGKGGS